MKLPVTFVLLGLLMAAISAFATDATRPQPRLSAAPASLSNARPLPRGIDRRPGIMPDWEAHANIVTLDELESQEGKPGSAGD